MRPPRSTVPVYAEVWDVDDPFDQLHPTMPNVNLIDDDDDGADNRPPGSETVWSGYQSTNAYGVARKTFTVSMQPGNNYRAAATLLGDVFDPPPLTGPPQVDQTEADAKNLYGGAWSGYQVPVVWSKMLTVWRKLHVETDSMTRPSFSQNTVNTVWNEPRFPDGTLVLDVGDQVSGENFENGFIRITAPGFPDIVTRIITFEHSVWDDVVYTNINEAEWGARPTDGNWPCTMSDDDLEEANFLAGIVGSDIGSGTPPDGSLPFPDTTGLIDRYKPAYILPAVESQHTSEGAYPFYKNMTPESKSAWDPGRLILRGLPVSTAEYWTVYVFSAFQPKASEDADSEMLNAKGVSTHPDGSTDPPLGWSDSYAGMAAVFVEVLRDAYPDFQNQRTVAHEIAHTLGARHLAGDDPGDGGLMDETQQGPDFLAKSLKELREYVEP